MCATTFCLRLGQVKDRPQKAHMLPDDCLEVNIEVTDVSKPILTRRLKADHDASLESVCKKRSTERCTPTVLSLFSKSSLSISFESFGILMKKLF